MGLERTMARVSACGAWTFGGRAGVARGANRGGRTGARGGCGTDVSSARVRPLASFHHIPLVALGLIASTAAVAGRDLPLALYAAAACGSWAVYAAARLVSEDDSADDDAGALWTWVGLAILAAVAALGRLPRIAWVVGAVVALPAALDALRRRRAPSPSDAWAKPLLIAAGWTGGGVVLPLAALRGALPDAGLLAWHAAAVVATVAANAILADAADRALDGAAGRVTLATRWGEARARWVGGVLAVVGGACAVGAGVGLGEGARVALVAAPLAVGLAALRLARSRGARVWLDLAVGAGGLALLVGMMGYG